VEAGGAADLPLHPGALRRFGDVARRHRPARIDTQAAAVEIFRGRAIELHRLLAALRDADELQEARAVGVQILVEPLHLLPEAVHCGAAVLEAEIGEIRVNVVHLRAPLPSLDRAAAGDPYRRMRTLHRTRPDIDIALLV